VVWRTGGDGMIDNASLSILAVVWDLILVGAVVLSISILLIWLYRDKEPPPIPKRKKKFSDPLEE